MADRFFPIHVGHMAVEQDNVRTLVRAFFYGIEQLGAIAYDGKCAMHVFEKLTEEEGGELIVFGDEDRGLLEIFHFGVAAGAIGEVAQLAFTQGEGDGEAGFAIGYAVDGDGAFEGLDLVLDDVEPESGALDTACFSGVEQFEDGAYTLGWNAGA